MVNPDLPHPHPSGPRNCTLPKACQGLRERCAGLARSSRPPRGRIAASPRDVSGILSRASRRGWLAGWGRAGGLSPAGLSQGGPRVGGMPGAAAPAPRSALDALVPARGCGGGREAAARLSLIYGSAENRSVPAASAAVAAEQLQHSNKSGKWQSWASAPAARLGLWRGPGLGSTAGTWGNRLLLASCRNLRAHHSTVSPRAGSGGRGRGEPGPQRRAGSPSPPGAARANRSFSANLVCRGFRWAHKSLRALERVVTGLPIQRCHWVPTDPPEFPLPFSPPFASSASLDLHWARVCIPTIPRKPAVNIPVHHRKRFPSQGPHAY